MPTRRSPAALSTESNLVAKTSSKASGTKNASPAALGYRMPAEWERHAATWLAWPHFKEDWPGKFEPIPWVFAEIVRALARHERVELVIKNVAAARKARSILKRADALSPNVRFHYWPTDRIWLRDSGCIFLKHGSLDPDKPLVRQFQTAAKYLIGVGRELVHAEALSAEHPIVRPAERNKKSKSPEPPLAVKFRFNA